LRLRYLDVPLMMLCAAPCGFQGGEFLWGLPRFWLGPGTDL